MIYFTTLENGWTKFMFFFKELNYKLLFITVFNILKSAQSSPSPFRFVDTSGPSTDQPGNHLDYLLLATRNISFQEIFLFLFLLNSNSRHSVLQNVCFDKVFMEPSGVRHLAFGIYPSWMFCSK